VPGNNVRDDDDDEDDDDNNNTDGTDNIIHT
jgi:hypothetical protein